MSKMVAHQVTLWDLAAQQERVDWEGTNSKTYDDLTIGDVVEMRFSFSLPDRIEVEQGHVAARHPVDGWEVQLGDGAWDPLQGRRAYGPIFRRGSVWRFIRHDPDWTLGPSPDAVVAWMTETAPTLPVATFSTLYHGAMSGWPVGVPDAWRETVQTTFTEAAIRYIPVAQYLRHTRKMKGAGSRIWACPTRIQNYITETIWPLPGDQRLPAILALQWMMSEEFDRALPRDVRRQFNRYTASIYEGYLRWAVAHAESARQLLEVLDEWGSNPVPKAPTRTRLPQRLTRTWRIGRAS